MPTDGDTTIFKVGDPDVTDVAGKTIYQRQIEHLIEVTVKEIALPVD